LPAEGVGQQRYTGALVNHDIFCHHMNIKYLIGISLYCKTTKYFSSKKKLLYQHSEITVLISFMTPCPSRSLFLATAGLDF